MVLKDAVKRIRTQDSALLVGDTFRRDAKGLPGEVDLGSETCSEEAAAAQLESVRLLLVAVSLQLIPV